MKITGKVINLRTLYESDETSIFENVNNYKIAEYTLNIPFPYKLQDAKDFIKITQEKLIDKSAIHLGIEDKKNKQIVGMISLTKIDKTNKNAEVGYWLGEKYWGKGYMKEALDLIVRYGFKNLKLEKIYAYVFSPNIKSQKRLEKAGFNQEGMRKKHLCKNNKWYDDYIYGILKDEYKEQN